MKMTLIDWAIVFAVGNLVFSGLFFKEDIQDPYMYAPVCDTIAGQPMSTDPRCLNQTEQQASALTALPHQTPPAVVVTPPQSAPSPGIAATN